LNIHNNKYLSLTKIKIKNPSLIRGVFHNNILPPPFGESIIGKLITNGFPHIENKN